VVPPAQRNPVCSICNATGWKSFQDGEVERVTRCDCWRDDINKRLISSARVPQRYHHCTFDDFITYDNDTLEDALEKAVHCLQDDFPVIRGSDMVGVISKQKILEALRAEGNGYVQAVMNRIFDVAQRGESLASAFRKLTTKNLSIIPVVEDQRLVGIVTLQNLMHSMALQAESRKLRKQALNS